MNEIEFDVVDGVGWLVVNRPAALNALNWAAQAQFAEVVASLVGDTAVRVLVIRGAGERAFVAGGDLKELGQHPEPEAGARLNRVMGAALHQLTLLPIPVIGAVNGDAFGGGCEILTACDLRIAADHARFCFAQVRQGLTTGWGGTGRLVAHLGAARALDLLLTARVFDAAEARRLGLVQQVVGGGGNGLDTAVAELANQLIALPQQAIAATKKLVYTAVQQPLATTNAVETDLFTALWPQPDHLEAMAAFTEKRQPRFNANGD